jgi:hypothetical protein
MGLFRAPNRFRTCLTIMAVPLGMVASATTNRFVGYRAVPYPQYIGAGRTQPGKIRRADGTTRSPELCPPHSQLVDDGVAHAAIVAAPTE